MFACLSRTDRDRAVWREAVQLSAPGPGEVDVVRLPRTGRTGVGTGNVLPSPSSVRLTLKLRTRCGRFSTRPRPLTSPPPPSLPGDRQHTQQPAALPAEGGPAHPEGRDARGGRERGERGDRPRREGAEERADPLVQRPQPHSDPGEDALNTQPTPFHSTGEARLDGPRLQYSHPDVLRSMFSPKNTKSI